MKYGMIGVLALLVFSSATWAEKAAAADDPFVDNACVQCHRDLAGRSG